MTITRVVPGLFVAAALLSPELGLAAPVRLSEARIYIEFNQTANDLGYHVSLDGEDWKELEILNPRRRLLFAVNGRGPYRQLGMTELFFEGAEPNLDDVPLEDLLALFPEGVYRFSGTTVDGKRIVGTSTLSHAVPNGPSNVQTALGPGDSLVISWDPVTTAPPGFPHRPISVVRYQLIVSSFQVTVPASVTSVTVPPEFVATLPAGEVPFEVLAIEASGNQTITESTFVNP